MQVHRAGGGDTRLRFNHMSLTVNCEPGSICQSCALILVDQCKRIFFFKRGVKAEFRQEGRAIRVAYIQTGLTRESPGGLGAN